MGKELQTPKQACRQNDTT